MSHDAKIPEGSQALKPKVSVVMPTHNRAKELPRSVGSVLSQSFRDFELIIIDDASTDNTEEVIHGFKDSRITYKKLEENVGGAEARNVGVRLAETDIIAFHDSDDEWRPHKLEKSMSVINEDCGIGVVFSSYIKVNGRQCYIMPNVKFFDQSKSFSSLLKRNVVGTPTLVVRKSLISRVEGFDPQMARYQDWELAIRLSKFSRLKFIEEPLVIANTTDGSISSSVSSHLSALLNIYNKNKTDINVDNDLKAEWLFKRGDAFLRCNDRSGRFMLLKAFLINPRCYKFGILFVASLLGCYGYIKIYDFLLNIKSR
ncbi:glycosyltransferase family 2 protein [Marinobacter sp. DUT-3]|uniref:glycosyltransferase family 2 protein n=1 Tax=Marinobacter sp. DUT-3 TaxID=3412036 RepID=UPI003D169C1C